MDDKKFALLIDADNISSRYIKYIVDEITNDGVITYKRIYGDWTSTKLNKWKEVLLEHSLTPMQQYQYTIGKNSTDSAMIIDAMDILYTGKVQGFCIASSDSDFTKLASRLREAGMIVIGIGEQKTPKPFVSACNSFKYVDVISGDTQEEEKPVQTAKSAAKSAGKQEKKSKQQTPKTSSKTPLEDIKAAIYKMIEENSDNEGWVHLSVLGSLLQKKYSDFDARNYGYKKMAQLLEKLGFEIKNFQDPNNKENPTGYVVFVRAKRI